MLSEVFIETPRLILRHWKAGDHDIRTTFSCSRFAQGGNNR
jgi:hypothetical protein